MFVIDYSNSPESRMIADVSELKAIILNEQKQVLILSIFNTNSFATPKYVRHVESEIREVEDLIGKQAVVGLTDVKTWILKGVNLWVKKKIHPFNSIDQALDYLTKE